MAKRKRSKTPKLVVVHWKDAVGARHGHELEPPDIVTAGWLVEQNDEYVKVASELSADGDAMDVTVVPMGMVQSVSGKPCKLPDEFAGWEAS